MKKSQAASEFSRTKTIQQQRRSLPVYGVRDDLLQARRAWGRAGGGGSGGLGFGVRAGRSPGESQGTGREEALLVLLCATDGP